MGWSWSALEARGATDWRAARRQTPEGRDALLRICVLHTRSVMSWTQAAMSGLWIMCKCYCPPKFVTKGSALYNYNAWIPYSPGCRRTKTSNDPGRGTVTGVTPAWCLLVELRPSFFDARFSIFHTRIHIHQFFES